MASTDVKELLAEEKRLFGLDPIGLIKGGYFKIKDKEGNLSKFVPNKVQMQVLDKIQEKRRAKKPVRIFILKGRQFGCSTLAEAILFAFSSQRPNLNAMVAADDEDGAAYLFEMTKLYHSEFEAEFPHLSPPASKSTETVLNFEGTRSTIRVETANKKKKLGRKFTLQIFHGSEVAYWPEFNAAHKSISQAVPLKPETIIIYETTANGVNEVCTFWRQIKKLSKLGETDWVPLFLSWKDHAEYSRPFTDEAERKKFEENLKQEEVDLREKVGLNLEQLHWRRWKIANDFQGDSEEFDVEFPVDDEHAFRSKAQNVFNDKMIRSQETFKLEPKAVGEVDMVDRRGQFMPWKNGSLKVFEYPKAGHRYVIGADSSESATGHDYACAQVLDRTTWRQVAVLHGRIAPDVFAEKVFALGAYYGWAHVVPEVNGPGLVTTLKLRDKYYPNLYRRKKMDFSVEGGITETEEFGFHSNSKSKPLIVSGLQEALRNLLITIHDEETIGEMKTFVVKGVSKDGYVSYGADDEYFDDRVSALMFALHAAKDLPETVRQIEDDARQPNRVTGY